MSTSENKRLLKEALAPLEHDDGGPFMDLLSDDVLWTVKGTTRWSRTYRGKEELVRALFRPFQAQLAHRYKMLTHRIVGDGDIVVLELTGVNVTKQGKPYRNDFCYVCRMEDGKVREVTEYLDTALVEAIAV